MQSKKEINDRKTKQIAELLSTPEGRISLIEKDMRLPMFRYKIINGIKKKQ